LLIQVYFNSGLAYALALVTEAGVLVEVPGMLSVCASGNRTRRWFPGAPAVAAPGEEARG
jgi:ACR3 family arsenite efflux pump ArsB